MGSLKSKVLTALALGFAGAAVLAMAWPSYRQAEPSIAGSRAPDFALELSGKAARLADLRGKVVVLNFWATWCPPCVEEAPSLNRLQDQIASRGGTVLGVSVDEDGGAYERFLREHNVNFPNYRDPSRQIAARYGTSMYPESYILTRDGHIAKKIVGPQKWDSPEITSYIQQLLASKN